MYVLYKYYSVLHLHIWRPLNTVAGYVFISQCNSGINSVGKWIGEKADKSKKLNDVMAENEDLKRQVDDLTTELNTIKLDSTSLTI